MAQITAVIATRNRGILLQESLQSILDQDIDLLVKVVRTAGDEEVPTVPAVGDSRVEVLECTHSHRGADGWAVGLATVTTPWTMTFDDDDLMFPRSLKFLVGIAERHDLDIASGLQVIFPTWIQREQLEKLPPEFLLLGPDPKVALFTWSDLAALRFPGMGHTVWRSELNTWITGTEQPPPGDSCFATKLFSAATRTGQCGVLLRAYRQHPDSASERLGTEVRDKMLADFVQWATSKFPEFASASEMATSSTGMPMARIDHLPGN